jgi:hypothetical protein
MSLNYMEEDWEKDNWEANISVNLGEDADADEGTLNSQELLKKNNQKLVESADNKLTEALFTGDSNNSIASIKSKNITTNTSKIVLKTKQEHTNFAIDCAKTLSKSTSLNIYEFNKTLLSSHKMSTEHIKLLIKQLQSTLNAKEEEVKKLESKNNFKMNKKMLEEHNEIFGEAIEDEYDHYEATFDRYM